MRLFAVLLLVSAPVALAQTVPPAPAANANVYNGTAHQPAAGDVAERERQTRLLPSQQQQRREDQEVDDLARTVQRQHEQTLPPNAPK